MGKLKHFINTVDFKTTRDGGKKQIKVLGSKVIEKPCKECGKEERLQGSSRGANCKKLHKARELANLKLESYKQRKN